MKTMGSKQKNIFIFAVLTAALLVSFQNCSSSLFMLGVSKPASAKEKTNLNDLLDNTEQEISATKNVMKAKAQFRDLDEIGKEDRSPSATDEPIEMTSGSDVHMQMVRKNTKKHK